MYLEDKPYNDSVLHFEREMRFIGLGALDEVTLVPLNKMEQAQIKTETKPVENTTQNTKKEYCFFCKNFGHFKAECQKMKRNKWQQTRKNNGKAITSTGKKIITPRLCFGETPDAKAYSKEDPHTKYTNDTTTECIGTPTEDWLRRQAIATIRRQLPQSDQKQIYMSHKEHRCDHKDSTDIHVQSSLTPEEQPIASPVDQSTNDPDEQPSSQLPKEDTHGSTKKSIFL